MVALWVVTRLVVLWLLVGPHAWVTGDVAYFESSLAALSVQGLAGTLVEYPLPGVALVALPWLVTEWIERPELYAEVVAVFALVTDAAFAWLLHRFSGTRERNRALLFWLLAVPLLGATTYARFDIVPGVLTGVAVLLLASHPRVAAAAGAVATAAKFWPALLLPALAARRESRAGVVVTVAVIGSALAGISFVLVGWARLVSPLTWQQGRGLHAESVLGTPAMIAWALNPAEHQVYFSQYNAFEIEGPGVPALMVASTVLSVLGGLALVVLWSKAWRNGTTLTPDAVAWTCLAAVMVFTVTSKVLSPQYLLWLLPAAAAAIAIVDTDRGRRRLTRWAAVLLLATALTQVVFPIAYGGIVEHKTWSVWVVLVLALRNTALVWLLVQAVWEAWSHIQRGSELERHPPRSAARLRA